MGTMPVIETDTDNRDQIWAFMASGHPLGEELGAWQQTVRLFGPGTPDVLMECLRLADSRHRPAAVYGLRAFGYEAWAEEFGAEEYFRVRARGESAWTIIRPQNWIS
jgi:hypothetical protein